MGISLSFSSAIVINEVELNPGGKDAGNEWVELYSETEINLEGYYFEIDNKTYNLSGIFSGYFIYNRSSQWLDNENETISLKNNNEIIFQTPALDDKTNDKNNKTWNLCDNEWEFALGSKEKENNCDNVNNQGNNSNNNSGNNNQNNTQSNNQSNSNNNSENNQPINVDFIPANNNQAQQNTTNTKQKIVLNSKKEDKIENSFIATEEKMRWWIIYAFTGFCVVLIIVLVLKKKEV